MDEGSPMELASRFRRVGQEGERGQVVPIVALAVVMLLGAAGMAVDTGYLRYMERVQQSAADSAAIAGANELAYPAANDVQAAARADAASNGFSNDGSNINVTVNNPPASGTYAGNVNAVEVIVQANHGMFFERILGVAAKSVTSRAVAVFGSANGAGNCIYALNSDIDMNSATINAPSCGIISNGIMNLNSDHITSASIGAVGAISTNSSTFPEASPSTAIAAIDPCPTIAGCAYLTANPPATSPCTVSNLSLNSATTTLNPGVYCQSVNMNSSNVTFNPGLYVFTNGLNANSTTMTGNGVTFYVLGSSFNANSTTFNLTAPSTGNYAGILFFQPPVNTSSANFNSSGGTGIQGAIYLPKGTLTTNSTFDTWLLIVAGDIHMNSSSVNVPANSTFPGSSRHGYLAE